MTMDSEPGARPGGSSTTERGASGRTGTRERVTALIVYGLILLLAYLVYLVLRPFFVPLGWAAVLVIFCYPWHAKVRARWGRTRAAFLSTASVTVMLIAPALVVMSAFITEAMHAFTTLQLALSGDEPWAVQRVLDALQRIVPGGFDVRAMANRLAQEAGGWLAGSVASLIQNTAIVLFDLVVAIFAAFFLFRDADALMGAIRHALPIDPHLRERLLAQTAAIVAATVTSSFIVAALQGLLGGLAFAALGITAPVFWGVVMALFCLLPLGAWVVWLPAAIWLMATGHVVRGLVLIGLGIGIVSAVDNFLRPVLISERTKLNGLLMFVSLLGGVSAFGVVGIMLGPVVMATAMGLFEAYSAATEQVAYDEALMPAGPSRAVPPGGA